MKRHAHVVGVKNGCIVWVVRGLEKLIWESPPARNAAAKERFHVLSATAKERSLRSRVEQMKIYQRSAIVSLGAVGGLSFRINP
jgi:hypothetical protein